MKRVTIDRVWRSSGINFAVLLVITYLIRGAQPRMGASTDALVSFYSGDRMRILITTALLALNLLNLLWFAAALASDLRDTGQGIFGAAATAASAAIGGVFFVLIALNGALAYSIVGSGSAELASALNDFGWAGAVILFFPAAMLVMAGSFGLWKADVISNGVFGAGVAAVVLVLAGGTTWASDGMWAPDGVYARLIAPTVALVWVATFSAILSSREPSTARSPERVTIPTIEPATH